MQRVHLILLAKLINIAVSFLLEHYFGSPRQTFPRIWTVLCGADMHNAMSIKGEGGGGGLSHVVWYCLHRLCPIYCSGVTLQFVVCLASICVTCGVAVPQKLTLCPFFNHLEHLRAQKVDCCQH